MLFLRIYLCLRRGRLPCAVILALTSWVNGSHSTLLISQTVDHTTTNPVSSGSLLTLGRGSAGESKSVCCPHCQQCHVLDPCHSTSRTDSHSCRSQNHGTFSKPDRRAKTGCQTGYGKTHGFPHVQKGDQFHETHDSWRHDRRDRQDRRRRVLCWLLCRPGRDH